MSVNKVILIGRLGQDPEIKTMESGNSVCNYSIATNEGYKNKSGEKVEKTEWHRIVSWGKAAEFVMEYFKKGQEMFIEGKLQTRSWEKDGEKRFATEIVSTNIQFVGSKNDSATTEKTSYETNESGKQADFTADDIPF